MISLIPTNIADDAIKSLYEDAFPEEERRPWDQEIELISTGRIQLLTLSKGDSFAGFLCYWQFPAFSFIEHFAIHPDAQGGGAGTQVMQLLESQLGPIVLEVEPPLTEQAIRRMKFYERLGYQTFLQPYQQPPYYPQYPPLDLCLMQKGLPHTATTFAQIKEQLYKEIYNK
jgi:GNAT superfamily N-acetyltransferase